MQSDSSMRSLTFFTANETSASEMLSQIRRHRFRVDVNYWNPEWPRSTAASVGGDAFQLLLVDSWFGPSDLSLCASLRNLTLAQLRRALTDPNCVPDGLKLIASVRKDLNHNGRTVYFVETPSAYLVQELIRRGVDWVWPRRSLDDVSFDEIIATTNQSAA